MQLTQARLLSILSLGLGSLLIGLLPSFLNKQNRQRYPLLISSLLCFGGGVLLSTSLVHILPEVRETLASYQQYAETIFCSGFFLLYLVDEIVHLFYDSHEEESSRQSSGQHHQHRFYGSLESDPLLRTREQRQLPYNPVIHKTRSDSELFVDTQPPPSQICHVNHQEPCNYGPVVNLALLVALSIHAILEGLVIGLETSSSKVLLLLAAVASHKLVVSFCLGIEITSNPKNSPFENFMSILTFALGSVIGIIIGIQISKLPKEITDLYIPILQALAGGTLLYITVSEVIPRERARWHQQHKHKIAGLLQLFSVSIGFASMTFLSMYLSD